MTPYPSATLRVALLVDSLEQPEWVCRALELALCDRRVQVVLIVRNAAPPSPRARSRLGRYWQGRHALLYALYSRLDRRHFRTATDPFVERDITTLLPAVPMLDVVPRQTRFSDYLADADLEQLRAANLDVMLRLGFRILRGDVLDVARHGVWSWHHGANESYRGGPAGFWEVMEGSPVTGALLQVLTEDLDGGRVLARCYSPTNRYSVTKNLEGLYWSSVGLLARALRDVLAEAKRPATRDGVPVAYGRRLYSAPGNAEMLRLWGRVVARRLYTRIRDVVTREQWILAFRRSSAAGAPDLVPFRFTPLLPPTDRFWADPFVARQGTRDFIFLEEFPYATGRGHISVMEREPDDRWSEPRPILVLPHHLSYPFVFEWQGDWYLVPESAATRSLELYRAVRFPYDWVHDRTLLAGQRLYDATIARIDDRWWMFATTAGEGAGSWEELSLFYAPSPLGPWQPHRRNPVIADVRCARPAGRLFSIGEAWYRPAQDSAQTYGHRIVLRRITRLTEDEYEEEPAGVIDPEWMPRLIATHTINAVPGLTVVDGRIRRWRW
jgi:hypothetical protein